MKFEQIKISYKLVETIIFIALVVSSVPTDLNYILLINLLRLPKPSDYLLQKMYVANT